MRRHFIILLIFTYLTCAVQTGYPQRETYSSMDIAIVLDNSNAMKTNDPEFLAKAAVSDFIGKLPEDSCISLILFSDMLDLVMPMTSVAEGEEKISKALNRFDYEGSYANVPAAIESAISQLKQYGRRDAKKLIILIADGKIEHTGGAILLEDMRAKESKAAGIRVFGIGFAEQKYFEPIRVLCRKTDGDHYRLSKAGDIQFALDSINEIISRSQPASGLQSPVKVETTTKRARRPIPVKLLAISLSGLAVIVIAVFVIKKKGGKSQDKIAEAYLVDIKGITDKKTHKISNRLTTIGRMKRSGVDICIPRNTISATHAQIEYKNRNFYLSDLCSRNGTFLGKEKISGEVCLKDGDTITFDQYNFKFVAPDQGKGAGMRADKGGQNRTILRME